MKKFKLNKQKLKNLTTPLLSLSLKLIPMLILSLGTIVLLGGRVSAATQTVGGILTSKPEGSPDPWCDYMESNYPGLCTSGGTGFAAADHSNITSADLTAGFEGGFNIEYVSNTIASGISVDGQGVCSNAKFTNLNIRSTFNNVSDDGDSGYIVYASRYLH